MVSGIAVKLKSVNWMEIYVVYITIAMTSSMKVELCKIKIHQLFIQMI